MASIFRRGACAMRCIPHGQRALARYSPLQEVCRVWVVVHGRHSDVEQRLPLLRQDAWGRWHYSGRKTGFLEGIYAQTNW